MSDYISSLEQALRKAAAREYRPAGSYGARSGRGQAGFDSREVPSAMPLRRRLRRRWSAPAIVVAALLVGGSAAATITSLLDTGSAPLTGAVPGITGQLLRYDIPITPDLDPGNAGWCSYPIFWIPHGLTDLAGGGTGICSIAVAPGEPVILDGAEAIGDPGDLPPHAPLADQHGQLNLVWMVVSARVAAVRLRPGDVIRPRPDPRLPAGWRAVVAFVRAPRFQPPALPTALGRAGRPITEPVQPAVSGISPSGAAASTRSYDPAGTTPSPCAIHAAHLPSITAQREVVATNAPALGPGVSRNELFSCARSWFYIKGQSYSYSAAILLNAQDPRRRAPQLPGLTSTGQSGVFINAPAEIVAKRIGPGWLVVQGQSVSLTKQLLSTLRVTGTSLRPAANPRP